MLNKLALKLQLHQLPRFRWLLAIVVAVALLLPVAYDSATMVIAGTIVALCAGMATLAAFSMPHSKRIGDKYALIVGAGTFADNVLLNEKVVSDSPAGDRTRTAYTPSWSSAALDQEMPQSAAFFVVYPVTGTQEDATVRRPPVGRGALGIGHPAGHADFDQARRVMEQRKPDFANALDTWDVLKKQPLSMIHVVATGWTSCAFFAETEMVDAVDLERNEHVVYFVDGKGKQRDSDDKLNAAIDEGLQLLESRLKRRPGLIITDNRAMGETSWEEHMRVLLMLSGSTRALEGRANLGDLFRITRPGHLWAPFVPKKFRVPRSVRNFNSFQIETMVNMDGWDCMWSGVKTPIEWDKRKGLVLLMAGRPEICAEYKARVADQFSRQGLLSPEAVIAPVREADQFWVAPLIHVLPQEVVDTYAGKVLARYCEPKPAAEQPKRG